MNVTETFDHWAAKHIICNEFVVDYKTENPHAVIKFGLHNGNDDEHCFVFDPELDVTLDPTQEQFSAYNPCEYVDEWYIGDDHPNMNSVESFDTAEAFEEAFF